MSRRGVGAHRAATLLLAGLVGAAPQLLRAQQNPLDPPLEPGAAGAEADVFAALPRDPQALADELSADVEAIRGLEFREAIAVSNQSLGDFERYVDEEMERQLPPGRAAVFGRVARALGLHRGELIEDPAGVMRTLATSQVAAYYDPDRSEFFVLIENAPPTLLAPVYAHELYHGLQDQYWDLDAYLLDAVEAGRLNDDEILARQAVVEGEATYVMNLWMMQKVMGQPPPRFAVTAAVVAQSLMSASSLASLAGAEALPGGDNAELQAAAEAIEEIPAFLLETMVGAYLKGMAFVHAVVAGGWDDVASLYTEPPRSTEQILHPDKWLERDDPVAIAFPDLAAEPALAGWDVLESNVIGEFQWRVIFREFGMAASATRAAAGWDGDRFVVLGRGDDDLLLLDTAWDSEDEAEEFAAAYMRLLERKYEPGSHPVRVDRQGAAVRIVEGGERERLDDYLDVLGRATRSH